MYQVLHGLALEREKKRGTKTCLFFRIFGCKEIIEISSDQEARENAYFWDSVCQVFYSFVLEFFIQISFIITLPILSLLIGTSRYKLFDEKMSYLFFFCNYFLLTKGLIMPTTSFTFRRMLPYLRTFWETKFLFSLHPTSYIN